MTSTFQSPTRNNCGDQAGTTFTATFSSSPYKPRSRLLAMKERLSRQRLKQFKIQDDHRQNCNGSQLQPQEQFHHHRTEPVDVVDDDEEDDDGGDVRTSPGNQLPAVGLGLVQQHRVELVPVKGRRFQKQHQQLPAPSVSTGGSSRLISSLSCASGKSKNGKRLVKSTSMESGVDR